MSRPIRVLVADDEPLLRAGVATVLAAAPDVEVVAQAGDGHAAVEAALRYRVDVALLDIRMPGLDGLGAVDELRRRAPGTRVVLLTSFGEEENVRRAVRAGVAGFVLKTCAPDELVRAVRAAHEGQAYLSPAVARQVLGMVETADTDRRADARARLGRLTARESQVLDLLALGRANAEIARALRMSEASVKTYVSRILAKLDCVNRVQAALVVRDARGS